MDRDPYGEAFHPSPERRYYIRENASGKTEAWVMHQIIRSASFKHENNFKSE